MKIYYICKSKHNSNSILKAYTDKKYALRVLRRLYSFMYLKLSRNDSEDITKYSELYERYKMHYNFLPKWRNKKQKTALTSVFMGHFM